MKRLCCLAAAFAFATMLPPGASAAQSVTGRLSTVVEWFDDAQGDQAMPLYLYGFLNAKDLGEVSGLNFRAYGRLADDLADEVDRKSHLYYAYVEKNDLAGMLDARLGRQYVATAAGGAVLDGLDVKADVYGPLSLRAFGGVRVSQEEEYTAGDLALGAQAALDIGKVGDASLSYFQEWDDGDLAREVLGGDVRYDLLDALEASVDGQYNLLIKEVNHVYAELNYHRNRSYSVKGHYLYDLPVFRATSIYSVFAVDKYQEAGLSLEYRFADSLLDGSFPGLCAVADYTREFYEQDADANVFEFGFEKNAKGLLSGYLLGMVRQDKDGQDLVGGKFRVAYKFHPLFQPGVGIHYDVLERRLEESDHTTSSRIWAFVESDVTDEFTLEASVERAESDLYDEYYQGRLRLSYRF